MQPLYKLPHKLFQSDYLERIEWDNYFIKMSVSGSVLRLNKRQSDNLSHQIIYIILPTRYLTNSPLESNSVPSESFMQ